MLSTYPHQLPTSNMEWGLTPPTISKNTLYYLQHHLPKRIFYGICFTYFGV